MNVWTRNNPPSHIDQIGLLRQMGSHYYAFGFETIENSPILKELKSEAGQKFMKTVNFVDATFDPDKNKAAETVLSNLRAKDFTNLKQEERDAAVKTTANAFLKIYGSQSITTVPTIESEEKKQALLDAVIKRFKDFTAEQEADSNKPSGNDLPRHCDEEPLFPSVSEQSTSEKSEKKDKDVVTLKKHEITVLKKTLNGYISTTKWDTFFKIVGWIPIASIIAGIVHVIFAAINIHRIKNDTTIDADMKKVLLRNNKEALIRGFGELCSLGFVFLPIDIYKTTIRTELKEGFLDDLNDDKFKNLPQPIDLINEIAIAPNKISEPLPSS